MEPGQSNIVHKPLSSISINCGIFISMSGTRDISTEKQSGKLIDNTQHYVGGK